MVLVVTVKFQLARREKIWQTVGLGFRADRDGTVRNVIYQRGKCHSVLWDLKKIGSENVSSIY